jgi:AraC-like DNA-binding protein
MRASDLNLPLRTADPVLARILARYAAAIPRPPATFLERFRLRLAEVIEAESPSLDACARRMTVSTRTLQRQLAQHATTWRAELDAAREAKARQASIAGQVSTVRLASQLGYSDPRSLRRAQRRWKTARADAPADGGRLWLHARPARPRWSRVSCPVATRWPGVSRRGPPGPAGRASSTRWPELILVRVRLAQLRGKGDAARKLAEECLLTLPGHD